MNIKHLLAGFAGVVVDAYRKVFMTNPPPSAEDPAPYEEPSQPESPGVLFSSTSHPPLQVSAGEGMTFSQEIPGPDYFENFNGSLGAPWSDYPDGGSPRGGFVYPDRVQETRPANRPVTDRPPIINITNLGIDHSVDAFRMAAEATRDFGSSLNAMAAVSDTVANRMRSLLDSDLSREVARRLGAATARQIDHEMLYGMRPGAELTHFMDATMLGDGVHRRAAVRFERQQTTRTRPVTIEEPRTGSIAPNIDDIRELGGLEIGDTLRVAMEVNLVTFMVTRDVAVSVPHKDAGKVVTPPRMQRSMSGEIVKDIRMKDGSVKRTSDIGQPPAPRPKLKIPGRRGN